LFVAVLAQAAVGCSSENRPSQTELQKSDNRPSQAELQKSVAEAIPRALPPTYPGTPRDSFFELKRFKIEAAENSGTAVAPVWETRFSGSIEAKYDMFGGPRTQTVYSPEGQPVRWAVPLTLRKGRVAPVFGTTRSTLAAGRWTTEVQFQGTSLDTIGFPMRWLGVAPSQIIVVGTDEERRLGERNRKQFLEDSTLAAAKATGSR
jgi:hypothetical protein